MPLHRLFCAGFGCLIAYAPYGVCAPVRFECPPRITTVQSLPEPVPGWRESLEPPFANERANPAGQSEHNLDYVQFSSGVPEERASLVPDRESPTVKGKWTATWRFAKSDEIWFSCWYRGTSVILSRQLPPAVRACSVRYNKNAGLSVEGVTCE